MNRIKISNSSSTRTSISNRSPVCYYRCSCHKHRPILLLLLRLLVIAVRDSRGVSNALPKPIGIRLLSMWCPSREYLCPPRRSGSFLWMIFFLGRSCHRTSPSFKCHCNCWSLILRETTSTQSSSLSCSMKTRARCLWPERTSISWLQSAVSLLDLFSLSGAHRCFVSRRARIDWLWVHPIKNNAWGCSFLFTACHAHRSKETMLLLNDVWSLAFEMKHLLLVTSSNLSLFPSCAICLESFESSSDVKQLSACHHVFHTTCLTEWLLRHGNCPMCRSVISSRHRTPVNEPWLQQMIFQTLGPGQEPMNRIVVYPPIKARSLPQIASNTLTTNQALVSSIDTPQLPHFHSQTQVQRTPSPAPPEEDGEMDAIDHPQEKTWLKFAFLSKFFTRSFCCISSENTHAQTKKNKVTRIISSSSEVLSRTTKQSDDRDWEYLYVYV